MNQCMLKTSCNWSFERLVATSSVASCLILWNLGKKTGLDWTGLDFKTLASSGPSVTLQGTTSIQDFDNADALCAFLQDYSTRFGDDNVAFPNFQANLPAPVECNSHQLSAKVQAVPPSTDASLNNIPCVSKSS